MPDFEALMKQQLEKAKGQKQTAPASTQDKVPSVMEQARAKELNDVQERDMNRSDVNPSIGYAGFESEEDKQRYRNNLVMGNQDPTGTEARSYQTEAGQGTYTNEYANADFLTESGRSFMKGLGEQVIGGWGDMAQVIGAATGISTMYDGNMVSRYLQEKGQELADSYGVAIPEALQDPNFDIKTLADPRFWSTHGAKAAPQMIEFILAGFGAGALAKKGATVGAKKLLKSGLVEGAEEAAERGITSGALGRATTTLKNTSRQAAGLADETYDAVKGSGLGRAIRDTGELTDQAGLLISNVAGGMSSNIMTSMLNAAQAYNSRKEMKDEKENPIYSKEDLSQIAANTFKNNLKWIGVDMLSWAFTYGGGGNLIKNSGMSKAIGNKLTSSGLKKKLASEFTGQVAPGLRKVVAASGKALGEGFEETLQEVYESWSDMKADEEVTGNPTKYKTFWDYYQSEDAEATKAIAFAMGALGGGVFGTIEQLNKRADDQQKYHSRAENLKTIFESGDQVGKEWQQYHKRGMIQDVVLNGKEEAFRPTITSMYEKGILTDEDVKDAEELYKEYQALNETAKKLNVRGKNALFSNHSKAKFLEGEVQRKQEELKENIAAIKAEDALTDAQKKKKIKSLEAETQNEVEAISMGMAQALANKANLLIGERVEKDVDLQFTTDENGKDIIGVGLNNSDYQYYVDEQDADIIADNNKKVKGFFRRIMPKDLTGKAKELFNNVKKSFATETTAQEEAQAQANENVNPDEDQKGETTTEEQKKEDTTKAPKEEDVVSEEDGEFDLSNLSEEDIEALDTSDEGISKLEDDIKALDEALPKLADLEADEKLTPAQKDTVTEKIGQLNDVRAEKVNKLTQLKKERSSILDKAKAPKQTSKNVDPNFKNDSLSKATSLDEKIHPNTVNELAEKVSSEKPLSKKEQALYDKFQEDVDKAVEKPKGVRSKFQEFVNKQRGTAPKRPNPETVARIQGKVDNNIPLTKREQEILSQQKEYDDYQENSIQAKSKRAVSKINESLKALFSSGKKESTQDVFEGSDEEVQSDSLNENPTLSEEFKKKYEAVFNEDNTKALNDVLERMTGFVKQKVSSFEAPLLARDYVPSISRIQYGPNDVDKMIAVNQRLDQVFPNTNKKVRAYIFEDLSNTLGIEGVGYAVGSSVFVDSNKWDQGKVFMHEIAHIYYKFMPDAPETKQILEDVKKNTKLIDKIKKKYPDYILYSFIDESGNAEARRVSSPEEAAEGTELPIDQQYYILEEAFVASLEGPLSSKYNAFFSPKEEYTREKKATKWWGIIKDRATADSEHLQDTKDLAQKLNDGKPLTTENMRDFMITKFNEFVAPIQDNELGFEARRDDYTATNLANKAEINNRIRLQQEALRDQGNPFEERTRMNQETLEDFEEELINADIDTPKGSNPMVSIMEKSFQSRAAKATKILRGFTGEYNKAIRLRNVLGSKKTVPFNKHEFMYNMYELAKYSPDAPTFVQKLYDSSAQDIQAFRAFMKIHAPGREDALMSSMWFVMSNFRMVNAMNNSISVSNDGTLNFNSEEALSLTENNRVQNMMSSMSQARWHANPRNNSDHVAGDRWNEFKNILGRIKDDTASAKDYEQAFMFIAGPNIKMLDILNYGYINVQGTNYSPVTVLRSFVKANRHTKSNDKKYDGKYVNPYAFGPIMKALAVTNRSFTQDSVVKNAKGDMVPARITNNHITKEMDNMVNDLKPDATGKVMSKEAFIKKYSHVTSSKTYRKPVPNQFLDNFYNSVVNNDIIPDVVYYTGNNDLSNNRATSYEDSTSYEQSVEDMMMFIDAHNRGKATYLGNMGTFGDSPRKFYTPIKRIKSKDVFSGNGFSGNGRDVIKSLHNIYRNLGDEPGNTSIESFEKMILDEVAKEREFILANKENFSKFKNMKEFFTNGNLNEKGENMVKEYVFNTIANGLYTAEVFSPNIMHTDIAKRLKNSSSPVMSINRNLKFEPIFFKDVNNGNPDLPDTTDGGMYILESDAVRWQNAGIGMFDLNNGFKFLNFSVEKENPNFKGQTMLLKGYTTVLNDAEVAKNPRLKGIYELLKKRSAKYHAYHNAAYNSLPSTNFNDGLPNSFPIAIPLSSEKTGIYKRIDNSRVPSISELNESTEAAEQYYDEIMYDKKNRFLGVQGYNFGPQQVMDKETDTVTYPVQQMNSPLVFSSQLGHLDQAEEIQRILSEEMTKELNRAIKSLSNGDVSQYAKFVKDNMDEEAMDQKQRYVIEKHGIMHPAAINIVMNQIANSIKVAGNKLKVPGTWAQQKSDFGYQLPGGGTINGSSDLNGYQPNDKGGLKKAEIVLPAHLKGKVTPRKYYILGNELGALAAEITDIKYPDTSKTPIENDLASLKKAAMVNANRRKVNWGEYKKDGKVVGYYVEGDTVLATRVPSNGPSFTGVFEAVDFTASGGNQVQVPTSFTQIIGADLDGDSLFIQHKGKNKAINNALDKLADLWLSPQMAPFLQVKMDTKQDGQRLKSIINKEFPENISDRALLFSPRSRRKDYEDSMVAKRNIGTVFNLHRLSNVMAAYNTEINSNVSINGNLHETFEDQGTGNQSRNYKSSLVANLILDNLSEQAADTLNINEHTVPAFALLVNLNVPIEDVARMMNSPIVKEYVNILNENNSAYHGYTRRADILKELSKRTIKSPDGKSIKFNASQNKNTNVVTDPGKKEFWSTRNQTGIMNVILKMDALNSEVQKISKIMAGHKGIETNPYLLKQQIQNFQDLMNNKSDNQILYIGERLKNNPDMKRYLNTAMETLENTQRISPVHRPVITSMMDRLSQEINNGDLSVNQIKRYTRAVAKFLNSRTLGTNNSRKEHIDSLTKKGHPNNVFDRMAAYIAGAKLNKSFESNTLLKDGLSMQLSGHKPYISLRSSFFDESLLKQEMNKMRLEFQKLPQDLQGDLFLYDLANNDWDSPLSLLPIFSNTLNNEIEFVMERDFEGKNNTTFNPDVINELERIIVSQDFHNDRNNFKRIDTRKDRSTFIAQRDPFIKDKLAKNEPFYYINTYYPKTEDGKKSSTYVKRLMKFNGIPASKHAAATGNMEDKMNQWAKDFAKNSIIVDTGNAANLNRDLITIKDYSTGGYFAFNNQIENDSKKKASTVNSAKKFGAKGGMESRPLDTDVNELFSRNDRLAKIGSQEQYKNYLASLFPDSLVRNIVYHGTQSNFDKFDISKIARSANENIKPGFFFTSDYKAARSWANESDRGPSSQVKLVAVDIQNPMRIDVSRINYDETDLHLPSFDSFYGKGFKGNLGYSPELYDRIMEIASIGGQDSVILENTIDVHPEGKETDDFIVFDDNAILALGSNQDARQFKKFVDNDFDPDRGFSKYKGGPVGMESREEYWEYDSPQAMSYEKFVDASEFGKYDPLSKRKALFDQYLDNKARANETFDKKFKNMDFSKKTKKELKNLYEKYAKEDAYAYAIITTPIIKTLAAKESAEQSNLTNRYMDGKDISPIKAMLMANNIPSNHPAVQGLVRQMEIEYKKFTKEKTVYMEKINQATDNLYKEKFGFSTLSRNPLDIIKRFFYTFLVDRSSLYNRLYGNIVETNDITKPNGKVIKEFKLRSPEEIQSMRSRGRLSDSEYEFYKVFREVTEELKPFSTEKGKSRRDYIPHTSMGLFESFSNRGLLGIMQSAKPENEQLYSVKMYFTNPDTGKKELVSFKDIDNAYKAANGNKIGNLKEYVRFRIKASKLYKQGKNEDGSDLQTDPESIASALSFGVMNRFANSRSDKATEMPSMDLNHALSTYVHSTLFVNGNKNFDGFKSMQASIDGILAFNQDKGLKNINKYVKLNWKDYFLQNKRQNLLGKHGDAAVDLITKLNLFYQIGFKASFLIGNIAAGKYHNIKNGNPKEWVRGERRFWGTDRSFEPLQAVNRFKRSQKILKNLNFMDINVYDQVSISSKSRLDNFFGDLALMPMAWSEKWIQGVQMLGMLTEEEWNKFDDNGNYKLNEGRIPESRITELENEVKESQGKGYQQTDQRAIQQYSLGRMFMQFARFIPTMFHDRFAKEDVNIYGKQHVGSLRAVFNMVARANSMTPKDFIAYRKSLSVEDRRRLDSGLKGLAMSTMIGAFAGYSGNQFADQTYWDTNYYMDFDKLAFKLTPSAVRSTENLINSVL